MLWPWSWGLLYLALLLGDVHAGVLDIQDNNPGMVYSGTWLPDASPNAHGKHETWTNTSGASVYYDFQGSLVQVFATMRPVGSYLTNVSFQIDDNTPDFWVTTENVPQETFNKLVYTSPGTLSTDGLHRITITNYGFVFWLVYLEITTPDVSGGSNTTSSTATATGTGTQTISAGTSISTSHVSNSSRSASRTPVIIGAVVGSVGGAALLLVALWFWCMHSESRKRKIAAMAPTPFAGQADPSTHFSKERPPHNPPFRFQRWITGSHVAASEPGYGYPSTGATDNAPQERAQSEPADPEALKQLAVFRSAAEARAAPGAGAASLPLHPTRPPPAASMPSVLETPHSSTAQSPQSVGPVSRSDAPPFDATMNSALASSGVLPPSPYAPPSRSRPVFFRVLRRSRDGGVRLAGGAPQEVNADMMAPMDYDQRVLEVMSEGSTLPPEYQQHVGGEGERAVLGGEGHGGA